MYDPSDPADRQRALDTITDLRERLVAGESFAELAEEYSDDTTSRGRGGDLLWQEQGLFETNFEDYVWSAEIGELSDVVSTSYGFHLIEVLDRHISDADRYEMELERKAREAERGGANGSGADAQDDTEQPAEEQP